MPQAEQQIGVLSSSQSSDLHAMVSSGKLPVVPPITSLDTRLPAQSDPVVVATSSSRFKIWANSDNSSKEAWVDDQPNPNPDQSKFGQAVLLNYWDNGPAAQYTLTLREYWKQVDGSYTQLPEGNSQSISVSQSYGISQTDSETITAEIGAEGGGLSAKLTAEFQHSVTTTAQTTYTKTTDVAAPPAGKIRVWVAWQLVDEIVALDSNGNIIPQDPNRKGEVCWNFIPVFEYHSGAFMSYKSTQHTFPSNNIIFYQRDFDAPV